MNNAGEINLLPLSRRMRRLPGKSVGELRESLDSSIPAQGYRISQNEIRAADAAGLFYAHQTIAQLHAQFGEELPALEIEDWPDFPVRGVMLDISRDKVPTMQTLFGIVDQLAGWKINQLQLYTEHTFAYRGHEEVWKDASPLVAEEIRELDEYCKARFIELVPNQNSFGHMERWLKHPRYLPLAEAPEGSQTPWGFRWEGPFSLCPTDARSIKLLADLYGQLLPNFSSSLFNVGCDETFDIGQGRSAQECKRSSVAEVYVNFLNQVQNLVASQGRKMMFWGDIILHEPKWIEKLPPDVIALNWGYEADHPFDEQSDQFARAGVPFYVCPGTSSWNSIAGRTDNMNANQLHAAEAGLKHGAIGYLNTDWGDHGHLQYWPISLAPIAFGAAVSWCLESNRQIPLERALNVHAFADSSSAMGSVALELGNVYKAVGKLVSNRSALFSLLVPTSLRDDPMNGITTEGLEAAEQAIARAIAPISLAKMSKDDAKLIRDEFMNAAEMLQFACARGKQMLRGNANISGDLQGKREHIIQEHRRLWLARNRPGGLSDSVARLNDSNANSP